MMNMSFNNRFFLFYNRMTEGLYIYELVTQRTQVHISDLYDINFGMKQKVTF
jgi:hypothetical protein